MKDYKKIKCKWPYLFVLIVVVGVLILIYWNANIYKPLVAAGGDEYGVFYIVKTIKEHGWYLENPTVGGITGGDMYDYVYSDSLSFLIVKIISLFFDNVYLIVNFFYFSSYIIVALISVYVCKKLRYRDEVAVIVAILYAFSAYIQTRYAHLWLTPYYLLPLGCMVAIWILRGEIREDTGSIWKSRKFLQAMFFSFLSAFTGFYYAFFTCVIYAVAVTIRIINSPKKQRKKEYGSILLIIPVISGVFINVVPNMIYMINHGINSAGELVSRSAGDAEIYGLKLVQLLLPRTDHRISYLNDISQKYVGNYPLINENVSASLGIIAAIGFIASLIWLFRINCKEKTYSYLNIGLFLIGTIGGVGSIFSLFFSTPMRAYNRISLQIMFISLLCVATILEKIHINCPRWLYYVVLGGVLLVGLFDQTAPYKPPVDEYEWQESTEQFVQELEAQLDEGSLIFQLPYVDWPSGGSYRMFAGYIESNSLRWSYGAMQGREEAQWQEYVADLDISAMLDTLIYSGYEGIYLDKPIYEKHKGEDSALNVCDDLTKILGAEPLISSNGELYFWNLSDYKQNLLDSLPEGKLETYRKYASGRYILEYGTGFYDLEKEGEDTWRWCEEKGEISITNDLDQVVPVKLSMTVFSGQEDESKLFFSFDDGTEKQFTISSKAKEIAMIVNLEPGENKITITCDSKPVEYVSTRNLIVQVRNAEISYELFRTDDLDYEQGFYDTEKDGERSWRWCSGNGVITIDNTLEAEQRIKLSMNVVTGYEKQSTLFVKTSDSEMEYQVSSAGANIELDVILKPGKNALYFSCDAERVKSADPRDLVFCIDNISITEW